MDAFTVAVATGAFFNEISLSHKLKMVFHFGFFQFSMPVLGWILGRSLYEQIDRYDHWIILILLTVIGGKMIFEAFKKNKREEFKDDYFSERHILVLSLATSIDALAIGISFAFIRQPIALPSCLIGVIAGLMTWIGLLLGKKIGEKVPHKFQFIAGLLLIIIGIRIFLEHQH